MTIAASFTPKPAILSFAITHELLTMRLFLDSLANNNFRMKQAKIKVTQKARVRKKSEQPKDTLKKAPFIMNDNGLNMRIKIKRKSR